MTAIEHDQKLGKWPGEAERGPLTDALRELWQVAYRDCYDSSRDESKCDCDRCIAVRAIEKIQGALYPTVRSLTPERLDWGFRERLFFEAWIAANERHRCVNGGRGTLEILCESLGPITQRDMDVASTVIQWLGTNCGQSFLHDVERKIKQVDDEARKLRTERLDQWKADVNAKAGFTTVAKAE